MGDAEDHAEEAVAFGDLVRDAPLVVLVHVDGTVVYANRCAEDILGVPPAGGRGLRLADLVHPEDVDRVRHRSQQAIERHVAPGSAEWAIVRSDGGVVRVESVECAVAVGDRTGVCVLACDVTERAQREAHLAHLATHDGLTGLPNRLVLLDRLGQAMSHIGRECAAVVVLFVDLDRFKAVNDEYGHASGDDVLREVARRLTGVGRAGDTVARLAGDEFVICAESHDARASQVLRRRVEDVLSEPYTIGAARVDVGASIGTLLLDRSCEPAAAIAEADRLMYQRKLDRPAPDRYLARPAGEEYPSM